LLDLSAQIDSNSDLLLFCMISDVFGLDLVGTLPNFTQTHCRVESIEDGERHGHVCDDGPRPESG